MEDIIKSLIYAGVGVAATATDKLQKTVDDLVERGKLPQKEGKKIVDDFVKTTEKRRDEYEERLKNTIKTVIDKFDMPKKKDYDNLLKRIEKLEKAQRAAKSAKATRTTRTTKSSSKASKAETATSS